MPTSLRDRIKIGHSPSPRARQEELGSRASTLYANGKAGRPKLLTTLADISQIVCGILLNILELNGVCGRVAHVLAHAASGRPRQAAPRFRASLRNALMATSLCLAAVGAYDARAGEYIGNSG